MTAVFGRVGNPVASSSFFLNSVNIFASSLRSITSTRFGGASSFTLFRHLGTLRLDWQYIIMTAGDAQDVKTNTFE